MAGSVAGSLLGKRVAGDLLLVLFALVMVAAGVMMLRQRATADADLAGHPPVDPIRVGLAGVGVGLLTGFFGVGGGFVIVPALTMVLGLPMATAIGMSLVVIAMASAAGFVTHLGTGAIDLTVTLFFMLGGLAGSFTGSHLAGRLPERALRRGFAVLVFALAAYVLIRNHAAIGVLA